MLNKQYYQIRNNVKKNVTSTENRPKRLDQKINTILKYKYIIKKKTL